MAAHRLHRSRDRRNPSPAGLIDLLAAADFALCKAKAAGRNRVAFATRRCDTSQASTSASTDS